MAVVMSIQCIFPSPINHQSEIMFITYIEYNLVRDFHLIRVCSIASLAWARDKRQVASLRLRLRLRLRVNGWERGGVVRPRTGNGLEESSDRQRNTAKPGTRERSDLINLFYYPVVNWFYFLRTYLIPVCMPKSVMMKPEACLFCHRLWTCILTPPHDESSTDFRLLMTIDVLPANQITHVSDTKSVFSKDIVMKYT